METLYFSQILIACTLLLFPFATHATQKETTNCNTQLVFQTEKNTRSERTSKVVEQGNESLETEITQFIVLRGLSDDAEEGPVDSCPGLVTLHSISSLSWVSRWQPMRGQHGKSSANQKPWCSHWESNCPDELW